MSTESSRRDRSRVALWSYRRTARARRTARPVDMSGGHRIAVVSSVGPDRHLRVRAERGADRDPGGEARRRRSSHAWHDHRSGRRNHPRHLHRLTATRDVQRLALPGGGGLRKPGGVHLRPTLAPVDESNPGVGCCRTRSTGRRPTWPPGCVTPAARRMRSMAPASWSSFAREPSRPALITGDVRRCQTRYSLCTSTM